LAKFIISLPLRLQLNVLTKTKSAATTALLAFAFLTTGLANSYVFETCQGVEDMMGVMTIDIMPDDLYCDIMTYTTVTSTPTVEVNQGDYMHVEFSKVG
jgi:hypothetical protein